MSTFNVKGFMKNYIEDLQKSLISIESNKIEAIAEKIWQVKSNKNTVFLIGNGGSSSTPSHSAGDWSKELQLRAICLTDNTAALTAFANDLNYESVFIAQLKVFLSEGDVVVAYSGSGNSMNVINAIEYARERGNFVIGISGNYNQGNGGLLKKNADLCIVVDSESMECIEDVHLIINHILKEYIKEKYKI